MTQKSETMPYYISFFEDLTRYKRTEVSIPLSYDSRN